MIKTQYFATLLLCFCLLACKKSAPTTNDNNTNGNNTTPPPTTPADKLSTSIVTYTDESAFANGFSSYGFKNPTQLTLDKTATQSGYNTGYGFNIPVANQVKGFKWAADDEQTEDWRPQGICGFTWSGHTYILVSWYGVGPADIPTSNNAYKGSKLALVDITDMSKITYRFILLVQNKANSGTSLLYDKPTVSFTQYDNFIPVTMHAGGVAYYNQKLYVVDTSLGLRVFDLNKLIDAVTPDPGKNTIGKQTNGTLSAFEYTCILPQSGYYKIAGEGNPFSSVSLGNGSTATDLRLWTCQYLTSGSPKVYGWPINTSGTVTGAGIVSNPLDDVMYDPVLHAQGVYKSGKTTLLSTTGNSSSAGSTARLVKYVDGDKVGTRYNWPHGAEALYLDNNNLLWCLTEYETSKYKKDNRTVFCVKISDYQ